MKMDAPDDLVKFKQKILDHFLQFRRCRSCILKIGGDFFAREVTDQKLLNNCVTIHNEKLSEEDVKHFVEKQHEDLSEVHYALPAIKCWLIPADPESEGDDTIFVVFKILHGIADGLSTL